MSVDRDYIILPLQGRWLAAGQTEGCAPLDRETPLHHSLRERSPSPNGGGFMWGMRS